MRPIATALAVLAGLLMPSTIEAQSVCLPAPRLLTTMPMGGQIGTSVEVTITGDNIEDADELKFSHPAITATEAIGENGLPVPNKFVVSITDDCPVGIHEARLMTRLGISSSRVFNVGDLPEAIQEKRNTSLESAMHLDVNSVCNAVMTSRAVDYYSFEARKDQRIVVDCAAKGIDSKLKPVVIVADANGADLKVERRGGAIDFTVPEDGKYIVKVHELTYNGGPHFFYRLAIREIPAGQPAPRLPGTQSVSSFSWPPHGLTDEKVEFEAEPNNEHAQARKISLPCDISGSFFPAADVDTFEFAARKGDVWWVEVASERLGLATDPSVVVQRVGESGELTDVAELSDIPSPVKVSSNGYSYDGPPYNAGSSDVMGRVEIKEDGIYHLQLRDLFGGTRNDPRNNYRLVVRKAAPDFALVGWALHMNLRNGDRNALSKPIALRAGSTMPIEVVVIRRDGFDGRIDLFMDNLPEGVTATGLAIPPGKSRGIFLVTADSSAPRGFANASFYGQSTINGEPAERPCRLASMQWPVPNAWSEIPGPRLVADVPVSVCDTELAPITIAPDKDVLEVAAGGKLSIPLVHTRRCDFSGANITLKTFGAGFEQLPAFDAPLNADSSTANIDLAALKTQPGEYAIAFYGSAVAKYRYNLEAVSAAEFALKRRQQEAEKLAAIATELAAAAKTASADQKAEADKAAKDAEAEHTAAKAAVSTADKALKQARAKAQPKDIVDIIVSSPITIRVKPAQKAE